MKKIILTLILLIVFFSCAKRGTPTGGIKDSIPPILVKSIPKINSVNFKDKKIKIYFDEYIKIKDIRRNLIISPPLKTEPVITPVGTASKIISIKILDTLLPNTTYQFNFGNSIVDNNEENLLGNFKYVFSTGNYIDSLEVSGSVYNPLLKENLKNIAVFLYAYDSTFTDSIIYQKKPNYVTNTLDTCTFTLSNIKEGKYLMLAIEDRDKNKIYNPKTDKIGFVRDTVTLPATKKYSLPIFKEIPPLKFSSPRETSKGHLIIGYEGIAKNTKIKILNTTPKNFKSAIAFEKDKDTINYWFTPFKTDSLTLKISNKIYEKIFNIKLRSSKTDSLNIVSNIKNELSPIDTLKLQTSTPIISFNKTSVLLLESDSIPVTFSTKINKNQKEIIFNFKQQKNKKYQLKLLPNTITDYFFKTNDSLAFSFKTKTEEDYAKIQLNVTNLTQKNLLIELYKDKYEIIRQKETDTSKTILFNYIPPGTYHIRAIVDANGNGKWDTGNYLKKIQPETIIYLNKKIEIRANWEDYETLTVGKKP